MFRDLTREQFKAIFLEHATRDQGWTWAAFEPEQPGMRYRSLAAALGSLLLR